MYNIKLSPDLPILIVDDNQEHIESLELLLMVTGIQNIIKCSNSRQVMEILAAQPIVLVFSDLCMPHLNGLDLLGMIRQQYPMIPVIIMTGDSSEKIKHQCLENRAFDFINKPVAIDKMIDTLFSALTYRGFTLTRSNYENGIKTLNYTLKSNINSGKQVVS